MLQRIVPLAALVLAATASASLLAPAVVRVPAFATPPVLRSDPNVPLYTGEYASTIKTPADRAKLADSIARQRWLDAQRWAKDGPGITVRLRRSRY